MLTQRAVAFNALFVVGGDIIDRQLLVLIGNFKKIHILYIDPSFFQVNLRIQSELTIQSVNGKDDEIQLEQTALSL